MKSKNDISIEKMIEKIDKLEKNVKGIDKLIEDQKPDMSNKITFGFDVKDVEKFLNEKKVMKSKEFMLLSMAWHLEADPNEEINGEKYIGLYIFVSKI